MPEGLVREIKRKTLSLMHSTEYKVEKKHLSALIDRFDSGVCENKIPLSTREIGIIITRMVRFHGGQTSVLRLGTQLARQGYHVTYLVYKKQSVEEMKLCATSNLSGYRGEVMPLREYGTKADIIIATSWDTVSYAKEFTDAYKMYFVQDYEPYFYKFGEEFFMSKSTYEQGLHMVSLGNWNKDMILRECKPVSPLDVVPFPYEKSEYPDDSRNYTEYKNKKKITVAVYLKYYGKRLPNLIPHMLVQTKEDLKKRGIELEVLYYGEAGTFKCEGGKNLGHLNKKQLYALYRSADFGMVASMSNISLVPYEMHASGLPVIEFEDGTYSYFFPSDSAILTRIGEKSIADRIVEMLEQPQKLSIMHDKAMEYMNGLSWEETGKRFAEIIEGLSGK